MLLIPINIIPLRKLIVGTRVQRRGRLFPCHCLSVLALLMGLVADRRSRGNA
jgi:hypothetical protein